jgi:hypothetical protein
MNLIYILGALGALKSSITVIESEYLTVPEEVERDWKDYSLGFGDHGEKLNAHNIRIQVKKYENTSHS